MSRQDPQHDNSRRKTDWAKRALNISAAETDVVSPNRILESIASERFGDGMINYQTQHAAELLADPEQLMAWQFRNQALQQQFSEVDELASQLAIDPQGTTQQLQRMLETPTSDNLRRAINRVIKLGPQIINIKTPKNEITKRVFNATIHVAASRPEQKQTIHADYIEQFSKQTSNSQEDELRQAIHQVRNSLGELQTMHEPFLDELASRDSKMTKILGEPDRLDNTVDPGYISQSEKVDPLHRIFWTLLVMFVLIGLPRLASLRNAQETDAGQINVQDQPKFNVQPRTPGSPKNAKNFKRKFGTLDRRSLQTEQLEYHMMVLLFIKSDDEESRTLWNSSWHEIANRGHVSLLANLQSDLVALAAMEMRQARSKNESQVTFETMVRDMAKGSVQRLPRK